MYVEHLSVNNVKNIKNIELDFVDGDLAGPRMWTVLVGENGAGKSTILKTIALLSGCHIRANMHLMSGVEDLIPRQRPSKPLMRARFSDGWSGLTINHDLELVPSSADGTAPLIPRKARPDHPVIGYGASRCLAAPRTSGRLKMPDFERLSSLFAVTNLIGLNFFEQLGDEDEALANAYLETLRGVFARLLPGFVQLERSRSRELFTLRAITLQGTSLSSGEQATLAWVADMIGQIFWAARRPIEPEDMRATVLIEQLDLNMHPVWQTTFIKELRALFPQIQFITTAHSPVILQDLAAQEVVRLGLDHDGCVQLITRQDAPCTMSNTQLLHTFFGVSQARQG